MRDRPERVNLVESTVKDNHIKSKPMERFTIHLSVIPSYKFFRKQKQSTSFSQLIGNRSERADLVELPLRDNRLKSSTDQGSYDSPIRQSLLSIFINKSNQPPFLN